MPAARSTIPCRDYTLREEPVDREEAIARMEAIQKVRLAELMEEHKGEVLRADFTSREENGRLTVTLLAECREEIGRTVERDGEAGRFYGAPAS